MHFIIYNAVKEILFYKNMLYSIFYVVQHCYFHHRASDILIDTPKFELDVGKAEDDTSGVLT